MANGHQPGGEDPGSCAVDGHFLHAAWVFSTSVSSAKARQVRAHPAVSTSYLEGEDLGVFTHGTAHPLESDDEQYDATLAHLTGHYGSSPLTWGDTGLFRMTPTWLVGYAADRNGLLASRGVGPEPRAALS